MSICYNGSMDFDEYQREIKKFDCFSEPKKATDPGFVAKLLGLPGEAGEVAEKFKKVIRDKNGEIDEVDRAEIVKELGDVLWYVATISRYLDVPFSEVAKGNIDKLSSRLERGKIHGRGDNR